MKIKQKKFYLSKVPKFGFKGKKRSDKTYFLLQVKLGGKVFLRIYGHEV